MLTIEIRHDLVVPHNKVGEAVHAINCLLGAKNPHDDEMVSRWQILYDLGLVEEGKILVPPHFLVAYLGAL